MQYHFYVLSNNNKDNLRKRPSRMTQLSSVWLNLHVVLQGHHSPHSCRLLLMYNKRYTWHTSSIVATDAHE